MAFELKSHYQEILVAIEGQPHRPLSLKELELLTNFNPQSLKRYCQKLVREGYLHFNDRALCYSVGELFPEPLRMAKMIEQAEKRREQDPSYDPDAHQLMVAYGEGFKYDLRQDFLEELTKLVRLVKSSQELPEPVVQAGMSSEKNLVRHRAYQVVCEWVEDRELTEDLSDPLDDDPGPEERPLPEEEPWFPEPAEER